MEQIAIINKYQFPDAVTVQHNISNAIMWHRMRDINGPRQVIVNPCHKRAAELFLAALITLVVVSDEGCGESEVWTV